MLETGSGPMHVAMHEDRSSRPAMRLTNAGIWDLQSERTTDFIVGGFLSSAKAQQNKVPIIGPATRAATLLETATRAPRRTAAAIVAVAAAAVDTFPGLLVRALVAYVPRPLLEASEVTAKIESGYVEAPASRVVPQRCRSAVG
jgi:hypothetical protein